MKKAQDLAGMVFGRLTVISRADDAIYGNNHFARWNCECSCGKKTIVASQKLKSGKSKSCGCLRSELQSKAKLHNLTNMTFGMLTVISRAPDKITPKGKQIVSWNCRCACGKEVVVLGQELTHGQQSCGCVASDIVAEKNTRDLTGMKFGRLTVVEKLPRTKRFAMFRCECECGNIIDVRGTSLTIGNTSSCGCLLSKAESAIELFLRANNVNYKKQYSFPDLVSNNGGKYRFDFGILDNDNNLSFLLEYQGIQHYQKCNNNFGDYQRLVSDPIKKEYAKSHNIKLV